MGGSWVSPEGVQSLPTRPHGEVGGPPVQPYGALGEGVPSTLVGCGLPMLSPHLPHQQLCLSWRPPSSPNTTSHARGVQGHPPLLHRPVLRQNRRAARGSAAPATSQAALWGRGGGEQRPPLSPLLSHSCTGALGQFWGAQQVSAAPWVGCDHRPSAAWWLLPALRPLPRATLRPPTPPTDTPTLPVASASLR